MHRQLNRFLTYLPLLAILVVPFAIDMVSIAATPEVAAGAAEALEETKPTMLENLLPIAILLGVIGLVFWRLPHIDVGHSKEYKRRRIANWLPLGLTYAFLYMGRYNLTVAKGALGDVMSLRDFSTIFMVGSIVYGLSFLINGPLTDKMGGRKTIIISAVGSGFVNILMGLMAHSGMTDNIGLTFSILYGLNMYFQSFGAVAIVKVNAPWFHVRERGTFGAIFGILISLGIYFAYDWGGLIVKNLPVAWVFFIPAAVLFVFAILDVFMVRDKPSDAGFEDFDPGDAQTDDGEELTVIQVFKKLLSHPVILTIAFIEFCSGFLRQSIMQYMKLFAESTGHADHFVFKHWGVFIACAGILGGMFAGILSDHLFKSRRGPVAALLYGIMFFGGILTLFIYETSLIGWMAVFLSLAIIGVHGMLSGTASMDFGGRKNTGIAVGIIDGFVYLGTGVMAMLNGWLLPSGEAEVAIAANWTPLFWSMIPVAGIGLLLTLRIWNAQARPSS